MTERLEAVFDGPPPLGEAPRHLEYDDRFDTVEGFEVIRLPAAGIGKPRLISSAHGPIRHIMLWYPGVSKPSTYADLLAKLPSETRVTIAAHPSFVDEIEEIARKAGDRHVEIVTTPGHLNFTVWAEDACVVVEDVETDPSETYLVEPFEFPRNGDQIVVDLVAEASDAVGSTQLPLYFQGGNVLIGDDFVLIGRDYLDKSIDRAMKHASIEGFPGSGSLEEREQFVRDLFPRVLDPERTFHFLECSPLEEFPPRIVEVEGERWLEFRDRGAGHRQPIFHIDMFVSLAGRAAPDGPYRVLVGDPALADKIVGWESVEHSLQSKYDEIAAQLEGLGFEVTRSPLTLMDSRYRYDRPGRPLAGMTEDVVGQIDWYHATANNCLVQILDSGARDVWLPTYGQLDGYEALAPVDARHREIWEGFGFTVHQLEDFHHLARSLGALHCIKKYLAR